MVDKVDEVEIRRVIVTLRKCNCPGHCQSAADTLEVLVANRKLLESERDNARKDVKALKRDVKQLSEALVVANEQVEATNKELGEVRDSALALAAELVKEQREDDDALYSMRGVGQIGRDKDRMS